MQENPPIFALSLSSMLQFLVADSNGVNLMDRDGLTLYESVKKTKLSSIQDMQIGYGLDEPSPNLSKIQLSFALIKN